MLRGRYLLTISVSIWTRKMPKCIWTKFIWILNLEILETPIWSIKSLVQSRTHKWCTPKCYMGSIITSFQITNCNILEYGTVPCVVSVGKKYGVGFVQADYRQSQNKQLAHNNNLSIQANIWQKSYSFKKATSKNVFLIKIETWKNLLYCLLIELITRLCLLK